MPKHSLPIRDNFCQGARIGMCIYERFPSRLRRPTWCGDKRRQGNTNVPVRVRGEIVHVQVERTTVRTIVRITAENSFFEAFRKESAHTNPIIDHRNLYYL